MKIYMRIFIVILAIVTINLETEVADALTWQVTSTCGSSCYSDMAFPTSSPVNTSCSTLGDTAACLYSAGPCGFMMTTFYTCTCTCMY